MEMRDRGEAGKEKVGEKGTEKMEEEYKVCAFVYVCVSISISISLSLSLSLESLEI